MKRRLLISPCKDTVAARNSLLLPLAVLLLSLFLPACSGGHRNLSRMDRADQLMESAPDSALEILDSIRLGALTSSKTKARYALLRSMALDKNGIDTISFEILRPAIDYYLNDKKGSPDDRLRTLYYKGRIFQNRKEDVDAMKCFIQASKLKDKVNDPAVLARTFGAMRMEYYKQGRYKDYVDCSLKASDLCRESDNDLFRQRYLLDAIQGCIFLEDREQADSIMKILNSEKESFPDLIPLRRHNEIIYATTFETEEQQRKVLKEIGKDSTTDNLKLDMADAYASLGCGQEALAYLDSVDAASLDNPLTYNIVKSNVLKAIGDYEGAYKELKNYIEEEDSYLSELMSQDLLFLEQKYSLEQSILIEKERKRSILTYSLLGIIALLLVIWAISLKLRTARLKKKEAEKQVTTLEGQNAELQQNLNRIREERDELKSLSDKLEEAEKRTFTVEFKEIVKKRLEMLNAVILASITKTERDVSASEKLVKKALDNKKEFLKSTLEVFRHLEPDFYEEIKSKGLNERKQYFVCLTALGLTGKEIGSILGTAREYHISSKIREKLGLGDEATHLRIYIREKLKEK